MSHERAGQPRAEGPRASLRRAGRGLAALGLIAAGLACRGARPAPAQPSLLLVSIDTLRADRVGAYGDALAHTPQLDAIARDGVLFERAFTAVPLTLPAHATLLTGLAPTRHGVRGNGSFALAGTHPTLAEALAKRGLATAAFVGAFPLARRFGLDRGFEHYDDAFERAPGLHFEFPERRAGRVVDAALAWLAQQSGPVFLWVHVYDPHAPYAPPEGYSNSSLDPYRGEIAYADAMLGRLFEAWTARPGPALVAVTSDHGEAFGEHGEESHGLFVYDTTLRVPLLLEGAGLPKGVRVASPVGLVDLAATLASLTGATGLPGTSLMRFVEGRSAASEGSPLYAETLAPRLDFGWSDLRAWREGRYKYIRAPRPELYDLDADPAESRSLVDADPALAARLAAHLEARIAEGEAESRRAPDPEAAERLRALGYVQGFAGRAAGVDPKDRTEVARRIAAAVGPFSGPQQVIDVYSGIAALDPGNPLVNFRLADALLRAGRLREARATFRKVVASEPRSADPYVGLATTCARLGALDEARRALEQALAVDPASGQAQYNLGELAVARGDAAQARTRYEAARADPTTRARAEQRLAELDRTGGTK